MMSKISLVIPSYRRSELLSLSLERIKKLKTQPEEILIIDDGSQDNTKEVADKFGCNYIYNNNPKWDTCCLAKNIGVKNALYDYLLFIEPETLAITEIVEQTKNFLDQNPDKCITAGTVYFENQYKLLASNPDFLNNPLAVIEKVGYIDNNLLDPHTPNTALVTKTTLWSAPYTLGIRKSHLIDVGGFDEDMMRDNGGGGYAWDDIDGFTRLRLNGIAQKIDPSIQVIHLWHPKPPQGVADGCFRNKEIFDAKNLADDHKEFIVANRSRPDWGVIIK